MLTSNLTLIPPDPIFKLTELYNNDPSPLKVNLGQGTYKTNQGQPFVFPAVKEAKSRIRDGYHEYLPILGLLAFRNEAKKLVFNDGQLLDNIASAQALSGTGSLHLAGAFLRRVSPPSSTVYITAPTWPNHHAVFSALGFPVQEYKYLDSAGQFSLDTVLSTMDSAPPHSIFILHASAHNPTGRDPTREQWHEICTAMRDRSLFPQFDAAYLGLTSGSVEEDVWPIRHFSSQGLELGVCLSFAKMMGLYGERTGALLLRTNGGEEKAVVESHLENIIRTEISNPPAFGARVASEVLSDPALRASWETDLAGMSQRLKDMRKRLVCELKRLGKHSIPKTYALTDVDTNDDTRTVCPKNFDHVVEQVGMFTILGVDLEQVCTLRKQYHIYMADSSRISVAGLNESNVSYVAESINAVCTSASPHRRDSPMTVE